MFVNKQLSQYDTISEITNKNQFSNTTDSCAKLPTTATHTACSSWIALIPQDKTKGNF